MSLPQEIEWQDSFKVGHSLLKEVPATVKSYNRGSSISMEDIQGFENITFNSQFFIAPGNTEQLENVARKMKLKQWRYYTVKKLPGAIIYLGAK